MNSSYIAPYYPSPSLPSWYINDKEIFNGNKLIVKEWEQEEGEDGRLKQGFLGYDFCHSKYASVRILEYFLSNTSISSSNPSSSSPSSPSISSEFLLSSSPKLEGAVYFSPLSESHRGSSHGGSFCAIMDDAIGWMGFCASGECKPWSGYTVQINTSLKNPIPTGNRFIFSLSFLFYLYISITFIIV